MNNALFKYAVWFYCLAIVAACSSSRQTSVNDYELDNDYFEYPFQRNVAIYHVNKDTTRFYVEVNNKNLLYAKNNKGKFTAQFLFEVLAYNSTGALVDSSALRVIDDKANMAHNFISSTEINLPIDGDYEVDLVTADLNRNVGISGTWQLAKKSPWSRYNFLILDPVSNAPMLSPYFTHPQTVYVKARQDTNRLTVKYFTRDFPLPPPPFANYKHGKFDYTANSTYTINRQNDSLFHVKLSKPGIYHIQSNADTRQGKTLYLFEGLYPEIEQARQMLPPLRYLLTSEEYNKLSNMADTRQAVENFWIKRSGDIEKARDNIKLYYNRVKEANTYYTSYVPGWKTDRGMIHLIFGKPDEIQNMKYGQRWIYGEKDNPNSITFDFARVRNPFTDNDYRLDRDEIYKPIWYRTVDSWRGGRPLIN